MYPRFLAPIALTVAFCLTGCGSSKHIPQALKPASFQPTPNSAPTAAAKNAGNSDSADNQAMAISPATRPATRPAVGSSSGTFMYIGTVVAEVNGTPIYADRILTKVDTELSTKTAILEPREFRLAAQSAIVRQLQSDIALEVRFAAALRNSTEEEQRRALDLAAEWRRREITKAGGSLAVARRLSLDRDGIDLEDRVKEQYQAYMVLIDFQNRLQPRVQISGDDLRRFYDKTVNELFTEKSGVRFRAIKIGVKESGSRDEALKVVEHIMERLNRGEDFDRVKATEKNVDRIFATWPTVDVFNEDGEKIGTEPQWIEPATLRLEQVEKAAFALQLGEVSKPIDVGDGFYILKLDQKRSGRVRPFEEPEVQAEIRRRIGNDQRRVLFDKEEQRLRAQAVVRQDEKNIDKTVEMAMQKYYAWSRANGLTRANDAPVQRGTAR